MQLAPLLAVVLAAASSSQRASVSQRPKMVVLSVRALDAGEKQTAELLSEVLLTELHKSQKFDLIGQTEIASLVGLEKQRQLLGCSEGSCLAEIGGALECEYIFIASLGRADRDYRLDLRLGDAKHSTVIAREGAMVSSKQALLAAARELITPLVSSIAPPPAPSDTSGGAIAAPAGVAPSSQPAGEATAAASDRPTPWLSYSLIGGGAVAAVTGGALLGVALSNKKSLPYDTAVGRANAGLALGGVGIAAALAGGALLVWGGEDSSDSMALSAGVVGGPFVSLGGRFP